MAKKNRGRVLTIDIKRYGGLQVAIVRGKIVASGRTTKQALEDALATHPRTPMRDIEIFAVPKTLATIYGIWIAQAENVRAFLQVV